MTKQQRYKLTEKGKAASRRHDRKRYQARREYMRAYQREWCLNKTIRKYTPGTPEYQANLRRVTDRWMPMSAEQS